MNIKFLNGLKSLCKLLITKITPFKSKITDKEYNIKLEPTQNIYDILKVLLNKNIKETNLVKEIKKLNHKNKKIIIDYVIEIENPDLICSYGDNKDKIIEILSKEIYYREEIINKIKKNNKKIVYKKPKSIVKSLEILTKEDFFLILNKTYCIDFFLLNYQKFNYTKNEKESLQKILNGYYYLDKPLTIAEINKIKERTSVCNIFPIIYKNNEINKENFYFFVKNINNIQDEHLKFRMIAEILVYQENFMFNTELYFEFFNENRNLIKEFEEFLKEIITMRYIVSLCDSYNKQTEKLESIIGLAEKLILEKELNNF